MMGSLVGLFGPALLVPAAVAALYTEWRDATAFGFTFLATTLLASVELCSFPH